mmetsp:Transcript_11723/g.17966  ORF Transcript_11723/g.17966 Transcript_11723/m.17966 type:complete len:350 (-) Transcript_11723:35-1084(-)
MKSSAEDTSKSAPGAASSTGLDLLFVASQLTSSHGSDLIAHIAHRRPAMPVDNGQYPNLTQRDTIAASRSNQNEAAAPSSEGGNSLSPVVEPNSTKSFVQILMDILNVEDPDQTSIICWVPDGESFLIADQERFEKELLPTYFRGSLFNSFVRKLNRWGFRRLKRTGKASSFAHDCFIRDKPWLCENMRCQSKPNFKKVTLKMKGGVEQTGLAPVQKRDDVQHHVHVPTSSKRSYRNINVNQSLSSPPFEVRAMPPRPPPPLPPPSLSSSAANIMEEQRMKREHLYASISQMQQQQQHRSHLQMNQMQYLNNMSTFTHEELAQLRYLQSSSSVSQYTRDMMHRNNTKPS